MASLYNLKRNSRVFFTTNLSATKTVNTTGIATTNTFELTVLDGFSFTQTTTAQAITLSEAGTTPVRGQRSFNTALNPVDFTFSTYMRPNVVSGVDADEGVLWNALFGTVATTDAGTSLAVTGTPTVTYSTTTGVMTITSTTLTATGIAAGDVVIFNGVGTSTTGASGVNQFNSPFIVGSIGSNTLIGTYTTAPSVAAPAGSMFTAVTLHKKSWNKNVLQSADLNAAYAEVTPARSNVNQLLSFGMIMVVDGITYTIDNCALDQASIDFGLDGIATVSWTGKGTQLNQLTTTAALDASANPVFSGGITGTATGKSAVASTRYLTNKLSTAVVNKQIGGGGNVYTLALTGGNIQIANNVNYLTPSNIGVVNTPINYYLGTRAITGTINAYLKTGGGATKTTGDLISDVLTSIAAGGVAPTELKYQLSMSIGGSSNATRVELLVNGASLQVPTVDASQDVVSTAIQFTAQGTDNVVGTAGAGFDVAGLNDMRIRYFAV